MSESSIIIIDDEKGITRLCTKLLEQANFNAQSFNDPIQAVEALEENKFDLLLVDIQMPNMDGFQVIKSARHFQPEIAVVIMTGFGTLETAIRALREGADGLILKPFENKDELIQTVKEALQERDHKKEMARLRAIRPLLDMTETLFSETRRKALIELILDAILSYMDSEHAAIYQRGLGSTFLKLVGSKGNVLPEENSSASAGLVGKTDHWKVPIWVNQSGPGGEEFSETLKEFNLGAVICSPISRGDSSLVFMAARNEGEPGFQLADLETFGLLARQADVALENSRLYDDLRKYVDQVEESQRALVQSEKMAVVGRLTASIAHEINNPLQAVKNCMHLVGRKELKLKEREEYLALAQSELTRLSITVQGMLDFYRPGILERKNIQFRDLVDLVLVLLRKQLKSKNIDINLKLSNDLPKVFVDGNQIQQVIFNIILNAMEAMPDGGKLNIFSELKEDIIKIYFQDSGNGVVPEEKDKLFEPFFSTKKEGNGLGLSVSYGIIKVHGGELFLVDNKDSGACFCISLPCEDEK